MAVSELLPTPFNEEFLKKMQEEAGRAEAQTRPWPESRWTKFFGDKLALMQEIIQGTRKFLINASRSVEADDASLLMATALITHCPLFPPTRDGSINSRIIYQQTGSRNNGYLPQEALIIEAVGRGRGRLIALIPQDPRGSTIKVATPYNKNGREIIAHGMSKYPEQPPEDFEALYRTAQLINTVADTMKHNREMIIVTEGSFPAIDLLSLQASATSLQGFWMELGHRGLPHRQNLPLAA